MKIYGNLEILNSQLENVIFENVTLDIPIDEPESTEEPTETEETSTNEAS